MPSPENVQWIKHIAIPTKKKQLRSYIGVINYYRDMWKHRSDISTPLTKMTSKQNSKSVDLSLTLIMNVLDSIMTGQLNQLSNDSSQSTELSDDDVSDLQHIIIKEVR